MNSHPASRLAQRINSQRLVPDLLRRMAFEIVSQAERKGRVNDILHRALAASDIEPRGRRFITELVLGTVRQQLYLDAELTSCYQGEWKQLEPAVKRLLRLGAYQLRFMDSVPAYAAVDMAVSLAKDVHLDRASGLVNAVLRKLVTASPIRIDPDSASVEDLAVMFSHPQWIITKWLTQWRRDDVLQLMAWNNRQPVVWFRKTAYGKSDDFLNWLKTEGLTATDHSILPEYFKVDGSPAVLLQPEFLNQGGYIVQDPGVGAVLRVVDPQPGETIIDLCAAPGGKTAALAEGVGATGTVHAFEVDHERIRLLNQTVNRLKLSNVQLYPADGRLVDLPPADKLLVDAPCTGTGVMSRKADLRWRRRPEDLAEMVALQLSLLENAARCLTPRGLLIYATCSLEPEENWGVVNTFRERHQNFIQLPVPSGVPKEWLDESGALSTFPPDHGVDGAFCVPLQRSLA